MSPWQLLFLSFLSAAFLLVAWHNIRGIRALRQTPNAEPLPPRHWEHGDYWPMVSVVVDAKAPPGQIEACIESLRSQDYPRYEILLAVPGMDRGAWSWLERPEPENGRLRLISVARKSDLDARDGVSPDDAVHQAHGSWLLFARGNETFHPSCLTSLVREALQHRADLVEAIPSLTVRPARGTGLLTAAGGAMSFMRTRRSLSVGPVEDASENVLAGESVLLVRRISHDEVDGFDRLAIPAAGVLHFVRGFHEAGLRVRRVRAAELVNATLDARSSPVSALVTDSSAAWIGGSRLRWLALSLRLMLSTLFPFLALGLLLGLGISSRTNPLETLLAVAGLAALTLQAAREFLIARSFQLPWVWLLSRATTLPAAATVVAGSFPRRSRLTLESQTPTEAFRTDPITAPS
ncbi:MAG: glycosyltransferase family 2 protein [Planctomycetaceae bacterium]|nr:glycosyltransferase family 2 protein [Planctomycetaceae bacterium]